MHYTVLTIILSAALVCGNAQLPDRITVEKGVEIVEETSWTAPMPEEHLAYLVVCCEKYHVPVELALAVIERESGFQPDAVSATNDYGYMQINEGNFECAARDYDLLPKTRPLDNIEFGVMMLDKARDFCGEGFTWERALMVYAMGPSARQDPAWERGTTETISRTMERADEIRESRGV